MSADMRYAIDNLTRSARNAGWDMTVNTALVRKLIAAAELAEADLTHDDIASGYLDREGVSAKPNRDDLSSAADAHWAAQAAYRKATRP